MIGPDTAWERLEPHLSPLAEELRAADRAVGRALTRPLVATLDVPGTDVSAMDGYALAGEVEPGATLEVTGTVAAGDPPGARLETGRAMRIMTGASVPRGADRVVPVEATDGGEERVRVDAPPPAGANVRRAGEIVREGDEILAAGRLLTPGALSLVAAHGHLRLPVRRAPRVALAVTGDEVVPPHRRPAPGQLRDTHGAFLAAACDALGVGIAHLGIVGDQRRALHDAVARGLEADVLLLTGGVSMGAYDFVTEVLDERGCEVLFHRVAIQPGKPLVAAAHPGGLVFGLPGNPASVMVGFWLFVRPVLRRLTGSPDGYWHGALGATLGGPLPGAKDRVRFLPAEVRTGEGGLLATPARPHGSHDLAAWAHGTALVRVPAGAEPARAGDPCEVLPLADWRMEGGVGVTASPS